MKARRRVLKSLVNGWTDLTNIFDPLTGLSCGFECKNFLHVHLGHVIGDCSPWGTATVFLRFQLLLLSCFESSLPRPLQPRERQRRCLFFSLSPGCPKMWNAKMSLTMEFGSLSFSLFFGLSSQNDCRKRHVVGYEF